MTATTVDSWALVRATQAGDMTAFGQLYSRYQDPIFHYLYRKSGHNLELSRDLTADTFTRALRAINTLVREDRNPIAWLITIAGNLLRDHYKRDDTRLSNPTGGIPEPRSAEHDPNDADTETTTTHDRTAAAVTIYRLLAELSKGQRDTVTIYDLNPDGCSNEVAGQVLGLTIAAVKASRHRALLTMRRKLAAQGITSTRECTERIRIGRAS